MLRETGTVIHPFVYRELAQSPGRVHWSIHRVRAVLDAATRPTDVPEGPIVVGLDMTSEGRRAAVDAAHVATSTGVPLHLVLSVPKPWSIVVAGCGESWALDGYSVASQYLDNLINELAITGVTRTITVGAIGQAVKREAMRLDAAMVVVRAHRPFGQRLSRLHV